MHLLGIDSATNSGGVALSRNGEVIGLWICKTPLRYSERLIPWIDAMLEEHGLTLSDIDCLAVASGPGSFTGIRMGLATVKALCQPLGKPAIAISTLEALAYRFRWTAGRIAPLIDARRQQVFGAVYSSRNGLDLEIVQSPAVLPPAQWLRQAPPEPCLFVGEGVEFYREALQALRPDDRLVACDNRIVDSLCLLAFHRYTRGLAVSAADLKADYVRPPDAEMGRESAEERE